MPEPAPPPTALPPLPGPTPLWPNTSFRFSSCRLPLETDLTIVRLVPCLQRKVFERTSCKPPPLGKKPFVLRRERKGNGMSPRPLHFSHGPPPLRRHLQP